MPGQRCNGEPPLIVEDRTHIRTRDEARVMFERFYNTRHSTIGLSAMEFDRRADWLTCEPSNPVQATCACPFLANCTIAAPPGSRPQSGPPK